MRNIIDRDIAPLEESIRVLKSRRNDLSPIYRFPAEILCNIFSLTEDLSPNRSPKSWTNYSQVSQRWRSSALSAPQLWTKIPLDYPRWAQEMLIRSKMAKLTIRSNLFFGKSNHLFRQSVEAIKSCLYELNRVEEINLTGFPRSTMEEIFRDLVPKSAPQLHTLCIDGVSIHEDFLYDTERLQRVELSYCTKISWDSRLLTGLTYLTLERCLNPNSESSIIQVLYALQRMPALTELRLIYSIPDESGGASTYPVVELTCLQILHISSAIGPLTTVLHHISFPHSAILNLTCEGESTQEIDFSKFLSVLATNFLSSLVIRSLQVGLIDTTYTRSGLEFYIWTTAFIPDCFPHPTSLSSQSQLQLSLTWPSSESSQCLNHGKVLTSALDAMNLSSLTQLQLLTLSCIDSETWVKTFGKLPLLERVYMKSSELHSFFEALVYKSKAEEKSKTAYRNISFPKLRYLHLEGKGWSIVSVENLLDYLKERREGKAGVQVLLLDDCPYISFGDVERLKEIVANVIWDGVERWQEDSEDE